MTGQATPSLYPDQPRVIRLMNTIWADRGELHDSLATATLARAWGRAADIPGAGQLKAEQVASLQRLRAGLRRAAAEVTHDDRTAAVQRDLTLADALGAIDGFLTPRRPTLTQAADGQLVLSWTSEAEASHGLLAALALEGAELLDGGAEGLTACQGPGCLLYFVKNHAKRGWCSAGCGNRARVARHYRRHRGSSPS